jgi:hypothetical protein
MSAIQYLDKSLFVKPRFPKKKETKVIFNNLTEEKQGTITKNIIGVQVFAKALLFELEKMKKNEVLNSFPLILDFMSQMEFLKAEFEKALIEKRQENKLIYNSKLRAIENILFMLIENDDLIFRTEKFVTTIKK